MGEKKKNELKELVADIILNDLEKGKLTADDNYDINYTVEYLNSIILELLLDGYTTKEVMYMIEVFENFTMEHDILEYDTVEFETKNGGVDWYTKNERIETVVLATKKVSWKINCQLIVDNQWGGIYYATWI